MSLADYLEDKLVDHVCGGAAFTQPAARYVKLHIGNPGEACTSNAAAETTRKAATFGASSAGTATTTSTLSWTSYPAAETVTHFSMWDASTAGNALGYGSLDASHAMQIGDTLNITSLTFTLD